MFFQDTDNNLNNSNKNILLAYDFDDGDFDGVDLYISHRKSDNYDDELEEDHDD
jgi:hypothetical protein